MEYLLLIKDTPVPTLLIVAGIVFLFLSIVPKIGDRINVSSKNQKSSMIIGVVLLLLGIGLYLLPADDPPTPITASSTETGSEIDTEAGSDTGSESDSEPPLITGVTLRENLEKGRLVIYQDINFIDKDGNTNDVEWELISLSDQSQLQYIDITNGAVNTPRRDQIQGSYTTGTWKCDKHKYVATLEVTLLDKDGNKSEPYQYTIECK